MNIAKAALVVAAFALVPFSVSAVEGDDDTRPNNAITISPTSQLQTLEAGESITDSFTVINTGATVFNYEVYGQTYSVKGLNYDPDYSTETERGGAYKWVTFEKTSGLLNPGEEEEIQYTLSPPANAPLGGHYGVLFVETQPEDEQDSQEILRKKRVGMVLRTNIEGDNNFQGSIVNSSLPWLQFSTPLKASLDVQNTGNIDFEVESTFTVRDVFGNEKYNVNKNNVIFPDTTRRIPYVWDGANWFGLYKVDVAATYLDDDFAKSRWVLIVPQWLLVLGAIGLVFGLYGLYRRYR